MKALLTATFLLAAGPVLADLAQDARVSEGRDLFLSGDEPAGLAILTREAEAGHPRAQNILGAAHQYGRGVPLDAGLTQDWMGRAAAQGYPPALHNLGVLFELGMDGLAPDDVVARDYYRQAAALDYGPSIGEYGEDLHEGIGGPVDRAEALRQFRRGAEVGDRLSLEWLGYMLFEGTDAPQDLEEARRLYQIAALMGSPWAQNEYGEMLEQGTAGPQDLPAALDQYAAAVAGDEAYAGINAAWLILENPEIFENQVQGLAYCDWAVANAPDDDAAEWQSGCDDWNANFSDKEVRQAELIAAGL